MNHNARVERFDGKYHLICDLCGELAAQPANRGGLLARAERHNVGRPGRKNEARLIRRVNADLRVAVANIEAPVAMAQAPAPIPAPAPVHMLREDECRTGEQWYTYVRQRGFKKLGQGASRKCYDLQDGRVVKINYDVAKFGDQCEKEVRAWDRADEGRRALMATILGHGPGYVIMEKAITTLYALNGGNHYDVVTRDITSTTGILDLHAANIGYFAGGKFKVLDYGI